MENKEQENISKDMLEESDIVTSKHKKELEEAIRKARVEINENRGMIELKPENKKEEELFESLRYSLLKMGFKQLGRYWMYYEIPEHLNVYKKISEYIKGRMKNANSTSK